MSRVMIPTPMEGLLGHVAGEWLAGRQIFGIPEAVIRRAFELEARSPGFMVMGAEAAIPVGPAAGPSTQIAQGLIAAYLTGARVFELKTVQLLDRLDIEKPCIETRDEGYNVEWSTELTLDEALGEYLRAWVAIHLLEELFSRAPRGRFLFNMSVGYTLEGIKSARVDSFIDSLTHPEGTTLWAEILAGARRTLDSPLARRAFGAEGAGRLIRTLEAMPARPVHSATLSTMHGCPPGEIEAIALHLIEQKGLSPYVKLNPTLLGYERVRSILDRTGWERIEIEPETFEKDLKLEEALRLASVLSGAAGSAGLHFGLKLSNTLACRNTKGLLPGAEMYLSGRPLFPVTVRLAAELAGSLKEAPREMREALPFSFCGGVTAMNAAECIRAGLAPLTVATDLLKPGGYLRLEQIAARAVEGLEGDHALVPDAAALERLADSALGRREHQAGWKEGTARLAGEMPLFDCFRAPCTAACPAGQNAPAYLRALSAGRGEEALAIVLADNPLPTVTGLICDHACTLACSRNDYEGPVDIRAMKLACARAAEVSPKPLAPRADVGRVAIFGAGPAGLSCASELALAGLLVTLFDRAAEAGGVVRDAIPPFRIARADVERDVRRIRRLGVRFELGWRGEIDLGALHEEGFTSFVLASGAPVARRMRLEGSGVERIDALEFLSALAAGPEAAARFGGPRSVTIAGGGFTAVDAARSAVRLPQRPRVTILYRRTRAEMPAERAEVEAALREGIELAELTLPERLEQGKTVCRIMRLGESDESGRRAPLPTDRTLSIPADLLIEAVGEEPDGSLFRRLGIATEKTGLPLLDDETLETSVHSLYAAGDAARGARSVIQAVADGRRVARAILRSAGAEPAPRGAGHSPQRDGAPLDLRGHILAPLPAEALLDEAERRVTAEMVQREAERCLSCDLACLRCVEVCPNRANVAIPVQGGGSFAQGLQILHIDALCNECGACGFSCPYEGKTLPYRDKPTLFASLASFTESTSPGFLLLGGELLLRAGGRTLRTVLAQRTASDPQVAAATPAGPPRLNAGAGATGIYNPPDSSDDLRDLTGELRGMYELAVTVIASRPYLLASYSAAAPAVSAEDP